MNHLLVIHLNSLSKETICNYKHDAESSIKMQARQSLIVRGLFPMLADPRHPVSAIIFLALSYVSYQINGNYTVLLI